MLSIEPLTDENKDSYPHVFFIISTASKEVLFSTKPMNSFFEGTFNPRLSFPFTRNVNAFDENTSQNHELEKNWLSCLQLKEKEPGNFSFTTATKDDRPVIYQFDALGVPAIFNFNEPCILFSVKKIVAGQNLLRDEKSREIHWKDYAEFIDVAAHDLDAPLRKITLLIERLVQMTPPEHTTQGHFDRIRTSLSEMRSLIDNLSALSNIGRDGMPASPCDLNNIVAETIASLRVNNPGKSIQAEWHDLPVVPGNKREFEQLFHHLVKNAVLYSQGDNVQVNITAQPLLATDIANYKLDPATNYTCIIVKDNGIGFAQEYAQKIFRPFMRLHGKSEYAGTGMGLAICKKVVEHHGGIIYAEAEENSGATFTLILPQSL